MLPRASSEFYAGQQRITAVALANMRRLWRQMGNDYDASWRRIRPQAVALMTAGQTAAARQVDDYLDAVLAELDIPDDRVGSVRPLAFVGVNGDGRPIGDLLDGAVIKAKEATAAGNPNPLAAAGKWLDLVSQTAIADSSRSATGVGMVARPAVTRWTRMLNPPSCSRCTILAGRVYRWNQGFQRHPGCDCRHIPATEVTADDLTTNPKAYFDSLSPADQDRIFTTSGAQAVRDGADLGQVVNARRGMYTTADGNVATRTGTSVRALAGRRLMGEGETVATFSGTTQFRTATTARLMPETIYQQAASRDEAISLLRRFGYLV